MRSLLRSPAGLATLASSSEEFNPYELVPHLYGFWAEDPLWTPPDPDGAASTWRAHQGDVTVDSFSRTVAEGWGRSDWGFSWSTSDLEYLYVEDGTGRVVTETGSAWDAVVTLHRRFQDFDMSVDLRFDQTISAGFTRVDIFPRISGSSRHGVSIQESSGDWTIAVSSLLGSSWTAHDSVAIPALEGGIWYKVRIQAIDQDFKTKIWARDIEEEPESWMVEASPTTNTFAVGSSFRFGFQANSSVPSTTIEIDNFAVDDILHTFSHHANLGDPTYRVEGIGGKPALEFDGTDDGLGITLSPFTVTNSGPPKYVLVCQFLDDDSGEVLLGFDANSPQGNGFRTTATGYMLLAPPGGQSATFGTLDNDPHVFAFSLAPGEMWYSIDGSEPAAPSGGFDTVTVNQLMMGQGADQSSVALPCQCKISYIGMFPADTPDELLIDLIEQCLDYYGIEGA